MYYRTYQENLVLIEHLERVHKGFKSNLGVQNKSRKWAVWQLEGALLGLAFRAVQYQKEEKDMLPIAMLLRLASEYLNQVAYFANPNTKADTIRQWYKVYYYSSNLEDILYTGFRRPSAKDRHAKSKTLPEGIDFSLGEYQHYKEVNAILSLWMHPSFDLTRRIFETDRNNGSYDLYNFRDTTYIDTVAGFETKQMINCAAQSLHIGSYLFGPPIALSDILAIE